MKKLVVILVLLTATMYGCATHGGVNAKRDVAPDGFVLVQGGTFQMGSNDGEDDEKPMHTVTVGSFFMGKYEVTQKEYQEIMGTNPSYFKGDNLPVEQVSWYDAIEYCNKRSQKDGLTPAYTIDKNRKDPNNTNDRDNIKWTVTWNKNANGYRLPTEVEWEYAARGGNGSPGNYTYSGSNTIDDVAWYEDNSNSVTHEVGKKKANGLGIYDMNGNVDEWCWDWYGSYSSIAQTDPLGAASGDSRVIRGGSWYFSAEIARSVNRSGDSPDIWDKGGGFRLVRPCE